jgi:shikimate dehydrogenase
MPHWREDGPAVVLGAGGAARAIVWALLEAGASDIAVVNRSTDRAASLAARFGQRVSPHRWSDLPDLLRLASLLVNTTSLGMSGQPALEITLDTLPRHAVVSDIVYAPLETELLAAARRRGHPVVDGLGMLLHQARAGFAAWFGVMPDIDEALRRAVLEA